ERVGPWNTAFAGPGEVRGSGAAGLTGEAGAARRAAADQRAAAWHEEQAEERPAARDWPAVVFHWDWRIKARPGDWEPYARRGYAHGALGRWDRAAADYAQAVERGAVNGRAWFHRSLTLLAGGDPAGYRRHCADLLVP